jgi:hypothetical protein
VAEMARRAFRPVAAHWVRPRGSRAGPSAERAFSAKRPARHQRYALTGEPDSEPQLGARAIPLVLGPPRVSLAERVQFFPASKPATGTELDISLPSIRNTRPCDADNRVFNASR